MKIRIPKLYSDFLEGNIAYIFIQEEFCERGNPARPKES
jgi:hypothetical protein